jgi:hypothetical protein
MLRLCKPVQKIRGLSKSTGDGGHTLKKPKLGILLARQIQIHSLLSVSAQAGRPSFSCNGACPPYVRNDSIKPRMALNRPTARNLQISGALVTATGHRVPK